MAGTAVVVSLTGETDAAAGFYIPLAPPSAQKIFPHSFKISYANYTRTADFAHCKFLVFCSLQPTKSACSAAAEKCLSGVGQPLSSVSGRKRYNILDFASKIVCQQGCFSPPIGNAEPSDLALMLYRIAGVFLIFVGIICAIVSF